MWCDLRMSAVLTMQNSLRERPNAPAGDSASTSPPAGWALGQRRAAGHHRGDRDPLPGQPVRRRRDLAMGFVLASVAFIAILIGCVTKKSEGTPWGYYTGP